jgi:signal transduction histidine kinase/ABC-type branched-subunit amino acid transport system ATPase component
MGDLPALRVRDLHKRFGGLRVLRGIDLDLHAGEVLALVGENGAGKSTLVQCVARTYSSDRGRVEMGGQPVAPDPTLARAQGLAVVWQDLALCDNLTVVANLFLGNERLDGVFLDEFAMAAEAQALFERLKITVASPHQPVGTLSGGQRQLVAIARAVLRRPSVLIVDEPTAALGVTETQVVERLLAELRAAGTAVLLVSHRLDQVFRLADRIAVLREGRIVAEVSPLEVHPDDVIALISGVEADSTARRQLHRLHSLVDQLAEVEPAASLPLIVSAMAEALGVDQLCVHLLEGGDDHEPARLRCSAAMGVAPALLRELDHLPLGADGGAPGTAADTGQPVVVEDVRRAGWWVGPRAGADPTIRSSWSVPIAGSLGVLGTISGYAETVGRPQDDQLELVSLYASYAASAIEREVLLADATHRNRVLETLRGVLDTLAGPQPSGTGLSLALVALCRGLGADAIALHEPDGRHAEFQVTELGPHAAATASAAQRDAARAIVSGPGRLDRARPVGEHVLAVPVEAPDGRAVVTAWWADTRRLSNDALDLLDDAARSLSLALEREALEQANAEAASLRRSNRLQQEFLSRLNHELRTPLTAIQGFASTLRQPDVSWDESSQQRFLDSIASESARMARLVGDLLDFSAIDSGILRLLPDWCDLGLVLEAARACVSEAPPDLFAIGDGRDLPPIWADHDRLEQVFVNLFENAVRHADGMTRVTVAAELDPDGQTVQVRVSDDGAGVTSGHPERVFAAHERGATAGPGAGLGLAIARGIVAAHGGTIGLESSTSGTTVVVELPVEPAAAPDHLPDHLPDQLPMATQERP